MARAQQRKPSPPMSLEEIGKGAFGTTFHAARMEGETAVLEFRPKQDGSSEENFRRIISLSSAVIPAAFSNLKQVRSVRLAALGPAPQGGNLVVLSMTRDDSKKVDWRRNATTKAILEAGRLESLHPAFQPFAQKGR